VIPAAFALALTLAAATTPAAPTVHTLPGGAARALTVGLGFATMHSTASAGVLGGITVHIGNLPGCYRIRFVPDVPAEGISASTIRLAKGGDAGAAGCPDGDAAEFVIPGAEAEAVAAVVRAWSNGALPDAPPTEGIAAETFSVTTSVVPAGSNTLAAGTIKVDLLPTTPVAGKCPSEYAYDPTAGTLTKVTKSC